MTRPKNIWLLHEMGEEGSDCWCDDPHPNMGDAPDSTQYTRTDEVKKLVETLEFITENQSWIKDGDADLLLDRAEKALKEFKDD